MRLTFPSHDGTHQVRVGHGGECVMVLLETEDYRTLAGLVLDPEQAAALGRRLIQQAKASKETHAQQA